MREGSYSTGLTLHPALFTALVLRLVNIGMNSRTAKALRHQIRHANVELTAGAWRVVKRTYDGGARTTAQLMRSVRLVRDANGQLCGLTEAEEGLLKAYAATHGQLEPDARVTDALSVVLYTAAVAAVLLAALIALALMLQ